MRHPAAKANVPFRKSHRQYVCQTPHLPTSSEKVSLLWPRFLQAVIKALKKANCLSLCHSTPSQIFAKLTLCIPAGDIGGCVFIQCSQFYDPGNSRHKEKETIDFYLPNRYTILNSKNDWREHPVAYQVNI